MDNLPRITSIRSGSAINRRIENRILVLKDLIQKSRDTKLIWECAGAIKELKDLRDWILGKKL